MRRSPTTTCSVSRNAGFGTAPPADRRTALLRLHPGLVQRAILLRGGEVLEDAPPADLSGRQVLLVTGTRDPFRPAAGQLATALTGSGAAVAARQTEAGHDLVPEDAVLVREWLAAK